MMPTEYQNSTPLQADDRLGVSDYESTAVSETTSLSSSLNEYIEQNGRRYHAYFGPDKNPMPTDNLEKERLDVTHELCYLLTREKLHQAPLTNSHQRVLDLGTGTGIWAIDFAQQNPHTEVVGIDLSPIQPSWVPPNCRFEVDDFEREWTFTHPFDFIHARTVAQSVNNWPTLLAEARRNLRSNGYIELAEFGFEIKCDDGTMPADYPPAVIFSLLAKALRQIGRMTPSRETLPNLLRDAGFTDVHVKTFKQPQQPWARDPALKQAGQFAMLASQDGKGYEAYAFQLLTGVLGMGEEETKELCKKADEAHMDVKRGVHAYFEYYVAYGRKA